MSDLQRIADLFNSCLDSNRVTNEDVWWAYQKSSQFPPDLFLHIPVFRSEDLLHLFLKNCPGILLSFLHKIAAFEPHYHASLIEVLNQIAISALSCFSILDTSDPQVQIKQVLSHSPSILQEKLFKVILPLFDIIQNIESSTVSPKFLIDESFLVTSSWLKDESLCSKFSSMTFFLVENVGIQHQSTLSSFS